MKVCKSCGSSDLGNNWNLCKSCKCKYMKEYYLRRGKKRREDNTPKSTCVKCGSVILLWRKNQQFCKSCVSFTTSEYGNVTNTYECGGGGGYSFKHRRIAESVINRKLLCNEIVHHIDENPNNNDVTNLLVMSRRNHGKLHKFLQTYRVELEKSNYENLENCWKTLRDSATKTWLETTGVRVIKMWDIGQSASEPLSE
jgi:hypothetical protein